MTKKGEAKNNELDKIFNKAMAEDILSTSVNDVIIGKKAINKIKSLFIKLESERDELKLKEEIAHTAKDIAQDAHQKSQQELQALKDAVGKLPSAHDPIYQTGDGRAFTHYGIDCKLAIDNLKPLIK